MMEGWAELGWPSWLPVCDLSGMAASGESADTRWKLLFFVVSPTFNNPNNPRVMKSAKYIIKGWEQVSDYSRLVAIVEDKQNRLISKPRWVETKQKPVNRTIHSQLFPA